MSQQARDDLIASPSTIFQRDSQRDDLRDPALTSTYLIELLSYLVFTQGWAIEFTAIRSDHHDDSALAPDSEHIGTHAGGWATDCWPLNSTVAGDYTDANEPRMQRFLEDCARAPRLHQIGLAGSAQTDANFTAAGQTAFADDGADHIHIGAQPV